MIGQYYPKLAGDTYPHGSLQQSCTRFLYCRWSNGADSSI